ncbi:MAG: amino acid permease [Hyphomicrobiales bacterium]|nr:amino acid permease [Hyphomicrobiales bacterium]
METSQQVLPTAETASEPKLKRSLNLPLLVLYGLGTTIGAGIYVLVGAAAGRGGMYAPIAFVAAAIAIAPTAASYGELAGRFPVSAGEAAYVNAGLKSRYLSILTGLLVIVSGVVASATIAIGCAGYVRTLIDLPLPVAVTAVIAIMGLVAAWGILESVLLAALFTLIEAGGLIILIGAGFINGDDLALRLPEVLPPVADLSVWFGIANAGLLAVFAFIGFEDMVNVAEETKNPGTTMPWAIFLTLGITAILYALVTFVAVMAVSPTDLAQSEAPLSMVFEKLTGMSPVAISAIAVFATLNTILVQLIMASRVIYGMAGQGNMPAVFSGVSAVTHTPLLATTAVVGLTWLLAIALPLERLAEVTSMLVLFIWVLTNLALIVMKLRQDRPPFDAFVVPMWVPVTGLLLSGAFIVVSIAG